MQILSLGLELPDWISPTVTIATIGFFFWLSMRDVRRAEAERG